MEITALYLIVVYAAIGFITWDPGWIAHAGSWNGGWRFVTLVAVGIGYLVVRAVYERCGEPNDNEKDPW